MIGGRASLQQLLAAYIQLYDGNVLDTSLDRYLVHVAQLWPPLEGVAVAGEDDRLGLPVGESTFKATHNTHKNRHLHTVAIQESLEERKRRDLAPFHVIKHDNIAITTVLR